MLVGFVFTCTAAGCRKIPVSLKSEDVLYLLPVVAPFSVISFPFLETAEEEAIKTMLDRDAKESEDDILFNIPAGTDFSAPLDDDNDFDDDDFDIDCHD